jgi:hypothetical protein
LTIEMRRKMMGEPAATGEPSAAATVLLQAMLIVTSMLPRVALEYGQI